MMSLNNDMDASKLGQSSPVSYAAQLHAMGKVPLAATVPAYTVSANVPKVELKPDLTTTSFSPESAFFFATMSKLVYLPEVDVRLALHGDCTTNDGMGFKHFHWFEADPAVSGGSQLDAVQDTEAFVAADDNFVMIVFRGSHELTDWTTNFKLWKRPVPTSWGLEDHGCEVHKGFDEGVDTVWMPFQGKPAETQGGRDAQRNEGMHATIKSLLYNEEGERRKLYVAGHSLGGALATIAAARLEFDDNLNIDGLYTIGSPRVFNHAMAAQFDATMKHKYFRCKNNNDIVTRVPTPPGFKHVGTEIYFDRFGGISTSSIWDRILGRLSALLRRSTIKLWRSSIDVLHRDDDGPPSAFSRRLFDGTNDHASSEYCRLFEEVIINSNVSLADKAKSVAMDALTKVFDKDAAKAQQEEIEAAELAALEASKETFQPAEGIETANPQLAAGGVLLCCLGFLSCPETSARRTPFSAFAQSKMSATSGAFPPHTTGTAGKLANGVPTSEVEMKPDLRAAKFSAQNAYFFANLSKIAYKPENEARGLVKGNSTCEGLGFDRFHWFEAGEDAKDNPFDAIHDTEAYVAANDEMIVVVFRGTKETVDWATNLNARRRDCPAMWGDDPGSLHEGFDDGVNTVWESPKMRMHKAIKDLCAEDGKRRKLYIAGHSLGGALATITAAHLAFEDDLDIAAVYTIGSPKVFDSTAAANFDSKTNHGTPMKDKYFRSVNNNDVVTRVPASMEHVGTEIYLDRFGTISTASLLDRILGRFSALNRGQLVDGIADHRTDEYVRHLRQEVINSRLPLLEKAINAFNAALGDLRLKAAPDDTSTNAAGEDFVFCGGITAPVYQKPFSVESSCRFFNEYHEYERNVKLSNSGQTVQRPLLTLSQLLPEHVRWCLADLSFEEKGDEELAESDLQRGLAQHGECWTGSDIHPNQAVAEVERLLEMRSEPTAVARIDAARARLESDLQRGLAQHGECWTGSDVHPNQAVAEVERLLEMRSEPTAVARIDAARARLEEYFENPGVARIFREKRKYTEGSARVITQALVRGLKPLEFKEDVKDALKVKGKWKENPNMVFNLIREQALIWRVVERRDEKRRLRGKNWICR
eukprot:g9153.t1